MTILTTASTLKVKLAYNLNVIVLGFPSTNVFIRLDFGPAEVGFKQALTADKIKHRGLYTDTEWLVK